jgi:hypothetical protein
MLLASGAEAQFGLYTLPQDDFQWHWGNAGLDERRRSADIEISGSESVFRCELTARTRPSSTMSPTEFRAIEMELRSRLDFIYAVSEAMNYLDQTRNLDWATLDCKKGGESGPVDPAKREARESEAREKMLRELERRRARQQSDEE